MPAAVGLDVAEPGEGPAPEASALALLVVTEGQQLPAAVLHQHVHLHVVVDEVVEGDEGAACGRVGRVAGHGAEVAPAPGLDEHQVAAAVLDGLLYGGAVLAVEVGPFAERLGSCALEGVLARARVGG